MADEPATSAKTVPAETTPEAVDPYELGDTEMELPPRAEPPAPPAKKPTPPKGPDGKFISPSEATEPPAPPDATPAKSKHPAYLTRQADDLGISAADQEAMSTDTLGDMCWRMNRQREAFRDEQAKARTMSDSAVKVPAPVLPAETIEEAIDLGLGEDEARFDPKLLEAIKRAGGASARRIKELEKKLEENEKREVQRETARASNLLDAAFAKLGAAYERFFGKGPASALGEPGKPAYIRRIAALQAAGITNLGQVDRDTIFSKLKAAADLLYFPDGGAAAPYSEIEAGKAPVAAAAKGRITQEQWEQAPLARPSHRVGAPEPNGDAKAIRNLEVKLRESGLDEPDSEIMDGLLPG